MPGLAQVLAILLAAGAPGDELASVPGEEPVRTDVVQAQTDAEKRMTIPVSLDGRGPFSFLIDTGSQRTVVSTALADQLSLEPGPDVRIVGVAGTDIVRTALIGEANFGRRTISDLFVPLFEERHIGADGILGTDSLQDQRVLLDFIKGSIELGDARSLGGNRGYEIVVRARRQSGQLIMTDASIDNVRVSVILDTGAGTSLGNRALQRALNRRGGIVETVSLQSVTGQSVTAELGFAGKLDIRDAAITNLVIAFTDTPAFTELELDKRPALFLGMRELRLFKRVAIDFPKQRIMFDLPQPD